jgi:hypothetical protein
LISKPKGEASIENRGLRRIFGPESEEVIGGWRSYLTMCIIHKI